MPKNKSWPTGISVSGSGLLIRIWKGGKLIHHETMPVKGDITRSALAAATKRREWLKARLNLGLSVGEEEGERKLFSEVATDYLETLEARDSTIIEYHRIINGWWSPELGKYPIDEITGAQIKKILSKMAVSTKTKKNRLHPLFGIFKHAEINPPRIKFKRQARKAIARYSPKERELVLSKMDGAEHVYFSLLFATGLRPGEALALEWSDYNGEWLSVSKSISKRRLVPTKTAIDRKVYVPKRVRDTINGHSTRFAGGHIFTNSHGRPCLDTDIFNRAWRKAHTKARTPYRIPYTCRHTRAAELLSQGVDPARAAQQLGHSVQMFLNIYSEFIEEYADKDMSAFEGVTAKKSNDFAV